MKTATKVKDLDSFRGMAALYRLSEPLENFEYVVVSAAKVPAIGSETYVFGANESGEVLNWLGLPGCTRGVYDHQVALNHAGYEVNE